MAKSTTTSTTPHIPRPSNSWILFRCDFTSRLGSAAEAQVAWKALTLGERAHWDRLAALKADDHAQRHPGYKYSPNKEKKSNKAKNTKAKCITKETSTNIGDDAFVYFHPIMHDRPRKRVHTGRTSVYAPYARPPTRSRASSSTSSLSSGFNSSRSSSIPSLYIDPGLLYSPSSSSSIDIDWTQYATQSQSPDDFSAKYGYTDHSYTSGAYSSADYVSEPFDAANTYPSSNLDYSPPEIATTASNKELSYFAAEPLDSGYPSFGVDLSFGMYPYGNNLNNDLGLRTTSPNPALWSDAHNLSYGVSF